MISPEDLDKNIKNLIKEQSMQKSCSRDYGYIIDIIKIISWKDMLSRNNGSNIITAQLEAHTFLPKVGLVIDCMVNMIFPQGIFAEYLDMKLVIPACDDVLKNFIFENQMFKNNDKIVKIGDLIKVEILNIRYNKNNFSCIGKLKI